MENIIAIKTTEKSSIFKGCVTRIVILSQISSHIAGAVDEALKDGGTVPTTQRLSTTPFISSLKESVDTAKETHHYFHSFDITPNDLVVFPSLAGGSKVINRIESEDSSLLAGCIESDELSSITFKNPKGFRLINPLVKNISNLEFIAQGDEYFDINRKVVGKIEIKNTSLSSGDQLENLSLKASSLEIQESVLDPLKTLSIELFKDDSKQTNPNVSRPGLFIDANSILRASSITIRNDNESLLRIEGFLQSTDGNIEIYSAGDVVLHNLSSNGKLIIHTPGKVVFEEDLAVTGGIEIHALSIKNKGELLSKSNIDFGKTHVVNGGCINAEKELSFGTLINHKSGHVLARKIHNLASILPHNEGTIECLDSCLLKSEHSLDIKGTFIVYGLLDCQFVDASSVLTLKQGSVVHALKGATIKAHTLNNHGKWGISGENLNLSLTYLDNQGDIESVNGIFGEIFKLTNTATIRTLGHSVLNCTTIENKETGKFYTAGVHHVTVTGTYVDSGYIYSPTLFLLQGSFLQFLPRHQSFIANGVMRASQKLSVSSGATINMRHRLQLISENTLSHEGTNNQFQDYNTAAEEALYDTYYLLNSDFIAPRWERNVFKAYVDRFLLGEWGNYLRSLLRESYGIVTRAQGDLTRAGNDNIQAGSSLYTTFGHFKGSKAYVKTGYFSDNHAQVRAESGNFSNVTLNAIGGNAVVQLNKDLEAKQLHIQARKIAELNAGGAMSLKDGSVQARIVALQAQKDMNMGNIALRGQDHISASTRGRLHAKKLYLQGGAPTHIEGDQGVKIEKLENENHTTIKSSQNVELGESVKGGVLTIETKSHLVNNAVVDVDGFTQNSQHLQNNKTIKAKTAMVSRSQTYGDTSESVLDSPDVVLDAPQTTGGFKGRIKAGAADIFLKDMQLQDVLNHADIQNTLTYRTSANMVVDKDLVVKCNLVLHALGLENKARITADKEFISFIKNDILNGGTFQGQRSAYFQAGGAFTNTSEMTAKGDFSVKAAQINNTGTSNQRATLEAENLSLESTKTSIESLYGKFKAKKAFQSRSAFDTKLVATEVEAGQSVQVVSAHDTLIQSVVERIKSTNGNYKDYAVHSLLDSGGSTLLVSGHNTTLIGARLKSVLDIGIVAQNFYSLALGLSEESTSSIADETQTVSKLSHDVSQIHANGRVGIETKGINYHQATDIAAINLSLLGQDVVIDDVQDKYYVTQNTKHNGGFFGQDREYQSQHQESISRGAQFKVFETIGIKALNSISVKNIKCQANETILEAPEVKILLGSNQMQSASSEKGSNILWVSNTQTSEEKLDHQASEFKGQLKINAKNAMVERVSKQTLDFMTALSGDIENLSEPDVLNYYNKKSKTVEGPSQALAMVIALAVSLTGAGSALGAAIVGSTLSTTLVGTMVSAAMTTLCSQAAVQLVAAKGNIVEAAEAMANTKILEAMALSAVTAGITSQLCNTLNLEIDPNKKNLFDNLQQKGVENAVNFGSNLVQGGDLDGSFKSAAVSTVVGALSASAAYEIGKGYSNQQFDTVTHKFLHAALGASSGALQSEDPVKGAIAGAIGATVAVTVADVIQKDSKTVAKNAFAKAEREKIEKTPENMRALIRDEVQKIGSFGKISGAMTAMLTKQDINIAMGTSANAIENNCLETMTSLAFHELLALAENNTSVGIESALFPTTDKEDTNNGRDDAIPAEMGSDAEDPYLRQFIATRKAQHEQSGKTWGDEQEAQARKETAVELHGIEPVTWLEDALSGGAGVVRQLGVRGVKAAAKYAAKKALEAGKDAIQARSDELKVQAAESLGLDSTQAQIAGQVVTMTAHAVMPKKSGVSHPPASGPASSSASQTYKEKYKAKLPTEEISHHSSYEQARKAALDKVGDIDSRTRKPFVGNLGVGKDKVVGFETNVNGTRKVYRVDYDPNKGPHINVEVGKGVTRKKEAFTFPGGESNASGVITNLDNVATKGLDQKGLNQLNSTNK